MLGEKDFVLVRITRVSIVGAADLEDHVKFLLTQCARAAFAAALFAVTFANTGRFAKQSLNTFKHHLKYYAIQSTLSRFSDHHYDV
jgi:hypothetical protein